VVNLLPKLLTSTNLMDPNICYVYIRLVRRNPYVPERASDEARLSNAAYCLYDHPMVLVSNLQYNSDAGRRRVLAGQVKVQAFEYDSAWATNTMSSQLEEVIIDACRGLGKGERRRTRR
jgi:hypothetical protein